MIIDAYTHWTPKNFVKELRKVGDELARRAAEHVITLSNEKPNFVDMERRLSDMDEFGFEKQVTMVHSIVEPNIFNIPPEEDLRLARAINDDVVELSSKSRGRIVGVGTIPLHALDSGGLEEMERAVDQGLKGFMVPTNALGKPLDAFYPALEKAAKLGVPIYVHPVDAPLSMSRPYEAEFDLMHVLGWPYETSLIWLRLVLSGIIRRLPNLNVVTHHLGGTIPYLIGRIRESYDTMASKVINMKGEVFDQSSKPIELENAVKRFYYDTAIGGNPAAIRCGVEVVGYTNIVFSTDYPWGPDAGRARMRIYPTLLKEVLGGDELERVFHGNIERLLKL